VSDQGGEHLESLNAAQRTAVVHDGGPLIVLAGPGTGKTRVIVRRIEHMIVDRGIDASSILALTFTNKAAGNMRDRLAERVGSVTAQRVHAHTFNGFGAMLLRRFGDLAGLPPTPELIDSAQRLRMMRTIVAQRRLFRDAVASGIDSAIGQAQNLIGSMVSAGLSPTEARDRARAHSGSLESLGLDDQTLGAEQSRLHRLTEIIDLWNQYDSDCLRRGLISFDHQVAWTNRLLRDKSAAASIVGQDYRHVVVDEFQDVNNAQIELLRLVAPPERSPDLCVVGDDDQAIYGFRGADDRAFVKFEKTWPGTTTVMLEENYRSASVVLEAAASVIGRAHERFRASKVIRRPDDAGADPDSASVLGVRLENHMQAGEVIASMIRHDLEAQPGSKLADHAVIARGWTELGRIRGALEIEGIPCRAARANAPSEDPGVLDVMAWIDILLNPSHTWSARRLLLRPPFAVPLGWVNTTERTYKAMRSRAKHETVQAIPDYRDWIRSGLADGSIECPDGVRPIVDRFIALWSDLWEQASTKPAHEIISEIVRRTDVVHAELLDGRARAARVSAVVGLLRFASERAPRLDEPRDLVAFMSYYEDLNQSERSLRAGGLSHEDDEYDAESGAGDAVQLLTAHSAKGLEFGTVYIPRVESQYGFPSLRTDASDEPLPAWLSGDEEPGVAAKQDEERRLFYVACTRAERRLVVLGKLPKNEPKGPNYFWELLGEPGLISDLEAADVLGPHPKDGVDIELPAAGWTAAEKHRARLREAKRVARLNAAAALEQAGAPGLDADEFGAIADRLRQSAVRMAVVESARRGEAVPGWVVDDSLRSLHAALGETECEDLVIPAAAVLKRMAAPLSLSYSKIYEWEQCPRCFAVRYVLGLPQEETAKIVVGTAVHSALEKFYKRFAVATQGEENVEIPTLDDLIEIGHSAFEEQWSPADEIDHAQRDRVEALLRNAHEHLHSETLNPIGMETQILFNYEHSGSHRFKAKIDRIDEDAGGFRVVDYKTGQATKRLIEPKKDDLQFGIYALAMRAFIAGQTPNADGRAPGIDDLGPPAGGAEYWALATGERGSVSFDELAKYETKLRARIGKAIDGMLAGEYPQGKKCGGACAFLDPGHGEE